MDLLATCITLMICVVVDTSRFRRQDPVMNCPLDMASLSVDDDYRDCSSKMSKLVDTKYLQIEKKYDDFGRAWIQAVKDTRGMNPKKDNLTIEHALAIRVYTYDKPNIHSSLNDDVREGRYKYIQGNSFRYHALHFLLMDAIQRLRKSCMQTYRGTNIVFANPKPGVRFGAFTSTSEDPKQAIRFGTNSCFDIITCHGASLSKFSKFPDEKEVLIPPYEVFKVVGVYSNPEVQPEQFKQLNCSVVYQLKSVGIKSNLRCALFKKGGT